MQRHGDRDLWLNPPPIPLTSDEMDAVYDLPYARAPHPSYGEAKIPAWDMIKFSVTIMRGCFGGCTFCSITEHEGRIIQNRSEGSILREIEKIRDKTPGFTGVISDIGGPTANMYRMACKDPKVEAACRRPSCVFPEICPNLNTSHDDLIRLYRKVRETKGIKKVMVASGVRYDLAVESPEYIKELVTHHVGGYLKIAPEHTERGPLDKMMKPGIGAYNQFKRMFDAAAEQAGKKYYLIPYFIAAHPGTTDEDMMNLALWLKKNRYRADQVQTFLPSPMATATAMYHTGVNPLRGVRRGGSDKVEAIKGLRAATAAQGVPALSRPRQLAGAARGLDRDGPPRPDRLASRPARARASAARHRQGRRHAATGAPRRQDAAVHDQGSAGDEVGKSRTRSGSALRLSCLQNKNVENNPMHSRRHERDQWLRRSAATLTRRAKRARDGNALLTRAPKLVDLGAIM